MDNINIRITRKTHKRLNWLKGHLGIVQYSDSTPTLDEVINEALDLLERDKKINGMPQVLEEGVAA